MSVLVDRVSGLVAPVLADLGLELTTSSTSAGSCGSPSTGRAASTSTRSPPRPGSSPASSTTRPDPGSLQARGHQPGARAQRCAPRPTSSGAVGTTVKVRTHPHVEGDRRAEGMLTAADDDGITVLDESDDRRDRAPPARTATSSGPDRVRLGARQPKPGQGRADSRPAAATRRQAQEHEQHRHGRGRAAPGRREGHLRRDAAAGAGRRARLGLQAPPRRGRRGRGPDRRRHDGHPHHRLRHRRGRQLGQPPRRHPERPRPHRRPDLPPGDEPAHPRGRARAQVRGVRQPRGRHRHGHHPAERQPLHAARPRARWRRCCPRPSRCPTSAPSRAPG